MHLVLIIVTVRLYPPIVEIRLAKPQFSCLKTSTGFDALDDGSYRLRLFQDLEIAKNADRQAGNASASDSAM